MLIRVMFPEAMSGHPALIDGGGEGYGKWGLGGFLKQRIAENVLSVASTGIIAVSCVKCSQLFFPWL